MAAVTSPDIEIRDETGDNNKSRLKCQRKFGFCDNLCACICCGICGIILVIILVIFITVGIAFFSTYPITDFSNVQYQSLDGETTLHAYVATPTNEAAVAASLAANSSKPLTAIVFHAWNGLSLEPVYFADRLAEQGYHAIAPDLFRGVATDGTNIIRNIYNVVNAEQDRMNADADAALAYLETTLDINPKDVISGPGFCFGGAQSLVFAARHEVSATVTCYGTQIRALGDPSSKEWGLLGSTGPLLGIYGEEDTGPSPAEVAKFEEALQTRGVPHNVTIYPGVGHAFITEETHAEESNPLHSQATEAWSQITNFMERAMVNHDFDKSEEDQEQRRLELQSMGIEPSTEAGLGKWGDGSFKARLRCAMKCALDVLVGTGHFHHRGLPTMGLEMLLEWI